MKLTSIEINEKCTPFFVKYSTYTRKVTGVTLNFDSFWRNKVIYVNVYPIDNIKLFHYSDDDFYTMFYDEKGEYIGNELSEQISTYLRTQELTGLL